MLEHFPIDIFYKIYEHLNVRDIHALASVNKGLRKTMLENSTFWRDQFQRHFPYRMNEVIENGKPNIWYSSFKDTFIAEYELNSGNKENQKEAYEKALLFTAAKNGDATELKKFFQTPGFLKKQIRDKTNHSIYYWLYKNGYQYLLDDFFKEFSGSFSEVDKFSFAILCNQQSYIDQCSIRGRHSRIESLRLAMEIGSVDLFALVFKKLSVDMENKSDFEGAHKIFVQAALLGHTDIVEFLHQQIMASSFFKKEPKLYCISIKGALQSGMCFGFKNTFKKILSIYDKEIWGDILNSDLYYDNQCMFLIMEAAFKKDPDYAEMLLQAGTSPSLPTNSLIPLMNMMVYRSNYEMWILLLKYGTKFDDFDYLSMKKLLSNPPKGIDPRICALAKLLIYQHEINHSIETPLSFLCSNIFFIERPQNKAVQCKVCDILLNVVTGKSSVEELSKLNEIEKAALHEKDSPLNAIFEGFSEEIEKMKAAEKKQTSNLYSLD